MAVTPSRSLFDQPYASPLGEAVDWLTGMLLGSVATTLCVLAIAFIGLMMLAGRFPVRRGFQVVIGCFLLLGAPLVAVALAGTWRQSPPPQVAMPIEPQVAPRQDLPPVDYEPYGGASLRRD